MMRKIISLLASVAMSFYALYSDAEVLGHISDETEPANLAVEPANNDDRQIIYRVICTPGGEVLPDCERPFSDTETVEQPVPRHDEEALPDHIDSENSVAPSQPQTKAVNKKTKKKTKKSKKSSTKKKTAKKSKSEQAASKE